MAAKALIPEDELCCSVCCDIFKEPVVLKCSHSFCKVCLKQYWEEKSSRECPICRRKASMEYPPVNLALKNIVESYLQQKTERETAETKAPLCILHGEKLVYFCERDKELLCLICQTSKKHRNHPLCPVEEAAQDLKRELKPSLNLIKEKLKRSTDVKQECEKTAEHIRSQALSTERQIKGEFEKLHQFLREEEEARLTVLKEEERMKSQIMEEKIEHITRDVSILTDSIAAIEKSMETDDTSFLKSYKSIRERAQCSLQDPELLSEALIDETKHLGNLKFRVWEKMLEMVQYKPSAPGRVEATDVKGKSVTLCWERPVSMEGVPHEIHITYSCEGEEPRLQKCAPNTTTAVLPGLRPGMEYTFNITAVLPNSSRSKTSSVCVCTKPFAPGRVKPTDVKSSSVRLCWERPVRMEGVPHEIHITYSCEGEEPRLQKCAPNTTTAVLTDLRPGMEYTFNISTVLPNGSRSKTSSECVCTQPSALGRVEATDVRSSSATLRWERPVHMEGVPHEIHITYSSEGEEPRLQKCAPNTTTAVLSDLRPGMEYTFNITTVLTNGSRSETSSVCVRTHPSAPGRVEATDVKSSSVTLCWERPVSMEGVPHEIQITYSCEGEEPRLQKCAPNTTTAVLTDLRPVMEYTFNITTVLPNGSCCKTSSVCVPTKPSAPGRVKATDVKGKSVTLCCERPVSMEGVLHEIHVTYSCEGEKPRLQKCAPNTTTAVLSGLRPGMEYTFNITTVLPNGSCSETSRITVCTEPSAPGRVRATDVKSSSMTLCWERPVSMEGVPHEIHITYSCEGEEPRLQKCAPNTTTAVLTDLRPGMEYTFNITTVLPNGSCSETSSVCVRTNPSAPGRVEATDVRSSSVTLCWERPVSMEGVPHEIHITYGCEGEEPRLQKCAHNTTITVLPDLRPVMEYTFNITTVLPNGSCSETSSACVCTLTGYSLDELSDLGLEEHLKNNLEIREDMFRLERIKKTHFAVMEQNVLKLIEKCRKSDGLTDEQLEAEFERMWADTVAQLKISGLEKRDVVQDIHHQLRSNLGREGSSVQEMLSKVRSLAKCGTEPFEVKSKDRRMFTKVWHTIFRDEHQLKTQNMADHIIKCSRQFVDEKVRTRSDYHSTYMVELLHMMDENLEQHSDLELPAEFKAELKIHICGHAAREFQKMHLEFICTNDPHHCLEQYKEQYCSDFKDLFHERDQCQKKAEEFTYKCLVPAVQGYITQSLGPDLVDEVLTGKKGVDLSTRTFFQFSLLNQLLKDDNFQDFVNYINNYHSFVQERIIEQMIQQFSEGGSLMMYEIKHLKVIVHRIKTAVKDAQMQVKAEKDQNIQQFIQDICRDLQKELIIPTDPLRAVLTLNTAKPGDFSECLIKHVDEMEQHLTAEFQRGEDVRNRLASLPFQPQKELFIRVFGCGQQCPFCRTPCEAGGQKHTVHFASLHRPQGVKGVRNLHSSKLEINICTSRVALEENFKVSETGHKWHPYKDYKSIYPDWYIQPDTSIEASDYWKYVFNRFNQQFAKEYKAEPADIPLSWKLVTKDKVMESLRESFQMKTPD